MSPGFCLMAGLLTYFATAILDRYLGNRTYATMSPEFKMKLAGVSWKLLLIGTLAPIVLIPLVLFLMAAKPRFLPILLVAGVVFVFAAELFLQMAMPRYLAKLPLSDECVRRFRLQFTIQHIGNLIAFSFIAYGLFQIIG